MTKNVDLVIGSGRTARVLDAAAELLVRLGYRRVTVEDVARAAGIGKGTVYLHFPTKEALFLVVLLRAQRSVTGGMTDRMRAEPEQALLSRMMSTAYRRLATDPVTRAVYLGNPEAFGRLAEEAAGTLAELGRRREVVLAAHLELLRGAGLVRTDRSVAEQRYLLGAVAAGFYLLDPSVVNVTSGVPIDSGARADLLEHAVAAALETGAGSPDHALAAAVADHYDSLIIHIDQEWHRLAR